jgi:dihydroorotase
MVALSDDGNPVCTQELMQQAFELAAACNIPISPHCEDSDFSLGKRLAGQHQGFYQAPPYTNETNFIIRDIACAENVCGQIHVSHVSMARSFDVIRAAKERGKARISCEITPHHILLDENFVDSANRKPKTNPPMRPKEDLEAAVKAIADGTVDVIATDHAPHTNEEVLAGVGGLIGLETALGLVLTKFVHAGRISIKDVIMKMSVNPANIFGLKAGSLAVGMPADIVIIDMDKEWTVDVTEFESKSRNSPFDGWQLKGKAVATIVGGKVVIGYGS